MKYPPCPLGREENKKHRDSPLNREMATATQLHDTAVNLLQFSLWKPEEVPAQFKKGLAILKIQIEAYENHS